MLFDSEPFEYIYSPNDSIDIIDVPQGKLCWLQKKSHMNYKTSTYTNNRATLQGRYGGFEQPFSIRAIQADITQRVPCYEKLTVL